ncbi:MAG: hypothetical protein HZB53_17615 [Chloroflexi bacterium]|nr:hypothetical protein [Chloroflexota bacterium]
MRFGAVLLLLFLTACGAATPAPTAVPPRTTAPAATATVVIAAATATLVPTAAAAGATPTTTSAATLASPGSAGETTDAKGNRLLGSPNAPVTLTDYSDFL